MAIVVPLVCVEIPKQTSVHKFVPRYEAPLILGRWRTADGMVTGYDHGNPVKIIPHPADCHDKEMFWKTVESFDDEFARLVKDYGEDLVRRLYMTSASWEEACLRALKDAEAIRRAHAAVQQQAQRAYLADPDLEMALTATADEWQALGITPAAMEDALVQLDGIGVSGIEGISKIPLMQLASVHGVSTALAEFLKAKFPTPAAAPDHEARDTVPLPGIEAPLPS